MFTVQIDNGLMISMGVMSTGVRIFLAYLLWLVGSSIFLPGIHRFVTGKKGGVRLIIMWWVGIVLSVVLIGFLLMLIVAIAMLIDLFTTPFDVWENYGPQKKVIQYQSQPVHESESSTLQFSPQPLEHLRYQRNTLDKSMTVPTGVAGHWSRSSLTSAPSQVKWSNIPLDGNESNWSRSSLSSPSQMKSQNTVPTPNPQTVPSIGGSGSEIVSPDGQYKWNGSSWVPNRP